MIFESVLEDLFLREDPQQEVPLVVRPEGGGDDSVVTWLQSEPPRHLPGVEEGPRSCSAFCVIKKFLSQLAAHLSFVW